MVLFMALLALSIILDGLDASIVNVALPTISTDLNVSIGDTSWVVLTYVVVLAALLLPLSKLANNGTVKKVFLIGVVIFTVSSVICGLSTNFTTLVSFRMAQGLGAAFTTSAVTVFITKFVPANRKGIGMGVLGGASAVSIAFGPAVGGFITSAFGWHWIFLINVPFCVASILLAIKILPKDEGYDKSKNPDLINSILVVAGVGAGIVCLQNLGASHMSNTAIAACGVASVILLITLGLRMAKHPEHLLISPKMLKRHDFQFLSLAFLLSGTIVMGTDYVLPYFFQICGSYSVSESGLLLSVASIFAIIFSFIVGQWCDTRGCRVPTILAGIGRIAFCLIFLVVAPRDLLLLLIALAIMGIALAFATTGIATALVHHAGEEDQADAATFMMELKYTAASLGVVLYSVVFQHGLGSGTAATVSADVLESSFDLTMIFGCCLAVVILICALCVKNIVPPQKADLEKTQ